MERETPQPEKSVEEEIARTYREWWPGKMGWAPEATSSGSAVKTFRGDDEDEADTKLNDWFKVNSGMQVLKLQSLATDMGFYHVVVFTKTISPEQMEQFDRVERKVAELIEKEDAEAAIQKAAWEEKNASAEKARLLQADKDRKEQNRLAELGRVHEKNCSKKGKK